MELKGLVIPCVAAGALLLAAASVWAQAAPEPLADRVYARLKNDPNTLADHARVDLAIKTSGVLTKALLLDKAQQEAFFPVYEAYQREWARFNNARETLLKNYLQRANSLDDAAAREVLAKCFALEKERVALLEHYAGQLQQKLPATLVVEFIEAELHIQNLRDVQLSNRLPDFR